MKQTLRLVLSLVASVALLWLAFRQVNLAEVWALLRGVDLAWVGLFMLSLLFIQIARGLRWGVLIRPFVKLSTSAVLRVSNIGMLMVFVLPLRLGEFARPYLMKKEAGSRMSAGIGAVVVERAVDGLLVTLLFFVSSLAVPNVPRVLMAAAYASLALFAGAMAFVLLAWVARPTALRLVRAMLSPISQRLAERAVGMLDAFVEGVRALPNARSFLIVIAWTLGYWLASGLGYYAVFRAFNWALPMSAGFTLVSVLVIAIMIPAGPGFLGPYQVGVNAGLALYGIATNEAAAYGLVVYVGSAIVTLAFGLPYFFTPRARLSEIVHASPEMS